MPEGQGSVKAIALNADETLMIAGEDSGVVRMWSVANLRQVRSFKGMSGRVEAVGISPDTRRVIAGDENGKVLIWDSATGAIVGELKVGSEEDRNPTIKVACYTADGSRIIVADDKASIGVFEPGTPEPIIRSTGNVPLFQNAAVAISPDRSLMVTWVGTKLTLLSTTDLGGLGQCDWRAPSTAFGVSNDIALDNQGRAIVPHNVAPGYAVVELRKGRQLQAPNGAEAVQKAEIHAVSPDGKRLAVSSWDLNNLRSRRLVVDVLTGVAVASHPHAPYSVVFPESGGVVFGDLDGIDRWSSSGTWVSHMASQSGTISSIEIGGRWALVSGDRFPRLIDLASGRVHALGGTGLEEEAHLAQDGSRVLIGATLVDTSDPWLLDHTLSEDAIIRSEISGDGRRAAGYREVGEAGQIVIWDLDARKQLRTLKVPGHVWSLAMSRDGRIVVVECNDTITMFDAANGRKIRDLVNPVAESVFIGGRYRVALSDDAKTVIASDYWGLYSWTEAGRWEPRLLHKASGLGKVRFGPTPKEFSVAHEDGRLLLFQLGVAGPPKEVHPDLGELKSWAWTPDGKRCLAIHEGTAIVLFETPTWRELGRHFMLGYEDTLTTTASGHFDTSDFDDGMLDQSVGKPGEAQLRRSGYGISWVLPDDPFTALPVLAFAREFYQPNLFEALMNGTELPAVPPLAAKNRALPSIQLIGIEQTADDTAMVRVRVSGAIKTYPDGRIEKTSANDVKLFRGGRLVHVLPGPVAAPGESKEVTLGPVKLPAQYSWSQRPDTNEADRKDKPRYLPFAVQCFSDAGLAVAKERGDLHGAPTKNLVGALHLVSIGVNRTGDPRLDLRYAANDARELVHRLTPLADPVFNGVRSTLLVSAEDAQVGERPATKASLREALEDVAKAAGPEDVVLLFWSGHGMTGTDGKFYLLPDGLGSRFEPKNPESLAKAVSSTEMEEWLRPIDATIFLVIDACQSAATVEPGFVPGPLGSRGLGQMAYDKGMAVLAATQSSDVAIEYEKLGHGILSYALIVEGLQNLDLALPDDQHLGIVTDTAILKAVTARAVFEFAVKRVPLLEAELAKGSLKPAPGTKKIVPGGDGDVQGRRQAPQLYAFGRTPSIGPGPAGNSTDLLLFTLKPKT